MACEPVATSNGMGALVVAASVDHSNFHIGSTDLKPVFPPRCIIPEPQRGFHAWLQDSPCSIAFHQDFSENLIL